MPGSPKDFVAEIISRFGERYPGSDGEAAAQQWIAEQWSAEFAGESVDQQPFKAATTAKFQSLKLFFGIYYICLALAWFDLTAAFILSLINTILFLGHFVMYRDWLDRFWPHQDSSNVIATLEPENEVRSTILVAGHVDAATEFQWWYRFGHPGLVLTVLAGFFPVIATVGYGIWMMQTGSFSAVSQPWFWYFLLATAPITLTMFSLHGKGTVDGAIDNLSGVAVAREVGLRFAGQPGKSELKHTRLKLISFGCEECGLKGSRAYASRNAELLRQEGAVLLNMESFRNDQHFTLLNAELFTGARYPEVLNKRMEESFRACGHEVSIGPLPIGATDATSLAAAGIPSTCVIGLDSSKLDETYHTRRDNLDNLDPVGMVAMADVLEDFIRKWDDQGWSKADF